MSKIVKISYIIGLILIILGSFLPWYGEGDFIFYLTYGVRIFPSVKDNGGLLIVLLSVIVLLLNFKPPSFIRKPLIWSNVFSFAVVIISVTHIIEIITSPYSGGLSAPVIQIGLIMVAIGSVILLSMSLICYRHAER
jgi:hypothetical protein